MTQSSNTNQSDPTVTLTSPYITTSAPSRIILLKHKSGDVDHYESLIKQRIPQLEPHFVSVIDHTPVNTDHVVSILTDQSQLSRMVALIITSQRAVESVMISLDNIDNAALKDTVLRKPVFAVGPATSNMLAEVGFKDVRGGEDAGHGADLVQIILEDSLANDAKKGNKTDFTYSKDFKISDDISENKLNNSTTDHIHPKEKFFLFLTGETRRDVIPNTLTHHQINFVEKTVYKTMPKKEAFEQFRALSRLPGAINDQTVDSAKTFESSNSTYGNYLSTNNHNINPPWVIFFSSQGTEQIVDYLLLSPSSNSSVNSKPPYGFHAKIASIGPTTGKYLHKKGLKPHIIAEKPSPASLVDSIAKFEERDSSN